jgi:hypothetical protein
VEATASLITANSSAQFSNRVARRQDDFPAQNEFIRGAPKRYPVSNRGMAASMRVRRYRHGNYLRTLGICGSRDRYSGASTREMPRRISAEKFSL